MEERFRFSQGTEDREQADKRDRWQTQQMKQQNQKLTKPKEHPGPNSLNHTEKTQVNMTNTQF